MNALITIMIIISAVALFLSLRIKVFLRLEDVLSLRAGLGPVVLKILPKKKKEINLRDFTYKKHQKRLEKERKKKLKKKLKTQKKTEAKALAEKAEKASQNTTEETKPEKLATVAEIIEFVTTELPRLCSYIHTDIVMLKIIVGGKDAAAAAKTYGTVCALTSLIIELLENKTAMKKMRQDAVFVGIDYTSPKIVFNIDFSFKISLFSIFRVVFHSLKWFISQKIKQSKRSNIK
ncbi:MAG: hypothetical protein E7672_01990 [Ruminococcaceae bacterium]|nr:hypothetical protein [Oscillospiraceae bacterium]